uniref:Uncharacterized protein n=1 Tax=Acrobeloides nanus TaxID=290746 RepID=A0A914DNV2_9BILA
MNKIEGVHLGIEHDLEKDRKEDYHVHHSFGQIMQISYIGLFESTEENFGCIVPGIVYWMKGDPIDMESDEEGGDSSKNAVVNREDEMDMLDVGVVDEATTSAVPSTSQQNEIKQKPKSRWERMKSFLKNKK